MNAADAKQYAAAFDLVEQRRKAGTLTDGEADVWRARLLAEMSEKPRPMWSRILIAIFYVALALLILWIIIFFINLT